jgi:hypothetical protein
MGEGVDMLKSKTIASSVVAFVLGAAAVLVFFREGEKLSAGAALEPEIILYSEPGFQGREVHLFGDAVDLPYEQNADGTLMLWNDSVGSIIVVSGTWRLYQHGRMNTAIDDTPLELLDLRTKAQTTGWSSVLSATSNGPLKIASPELAGIGSDISSIELLSTQNLPDWVFGRR